MPCNAGDGVCSGTGSDRRSHVGVNVLGVVTVVGPEGGVPVAGRVARCVLALLVLYRGQAVGLSLLVERVWGEDPPENASVQLRRSVRDLATATAGTGLRVVGDGTWFSLDAAPGSTDIDQFRRFVATGRRLLVRGRYARAVAVLGRAVGLWAETSPFVGPGSDHWPEAAQLREERVNAIEDHASALISAGRPGESVETLDRIARDHPLRESLAVLRMRALAGTGDEAGALDVYAEIERNLAESLGLDPGPESTREVCSVRSSGPSPSVGGTPHLTDCSVCRRVRSA